MSTIQTKSTSAATPLALAATLFSEVNTLYVDRDDDAARELLIIAYDALVAAFRGDMSDADVLRATNAVNESEAILPDLREILVIGIILAPTGVAKAREATAFALALKQCTAMELRASRLGPDGDDQLEATQAEASRMN